MKIFKNHDQAQQRVEALQQEAARLADQARDQLAEYDRMFDLSKQSKHVQSFARGQRKQLHQAAASASDQVATMMAGALENAAGQLRNYDGSGSAAQVAQTAAQALEHGSEQLQPWGTRALVRRVLRVARHYPLPTLLILISSAGLVYLTNRRKNVAD